MHLKVFVKLKKTLSSGKKTQKKTKKKTKKDQKNPLGWVFFKKNRVFSNPASYTSKHELLKKILLLWVIFALLSP